MSADTDIPARLAWLPAALDSGERLLAVWPLSDQAENVWLLDLPGRTVVLKRDRPRLGGGEADIAFGLWRSGRARPRDVALDPGRVRRFLSGYHGQAPIDAAVARLLPAPLWARGLQLLVRWISARALTGMRKAARSARGDHLMPAITEGCQAAHDFFVRQTATGVQVAVCFLQGRKEVRILRVIITEQVPTEHLLNRRMDACQRRQFVLSPYLGHFDHETAQMFEVLDRNGDSGHGVSLRPIIGPEGRRRYPSARVDRARAVPPLRAFAPLRETEPSTGACCTAWGRASSG